MIKKVRKIFLLLLISITLLPSNVYAYSDYIIASGKNIGIELNTTGIIIVGTYDVGDYSPAKDAKLQTGDKIIRINDTKVDSIKEMIALIEKDVTTESIKVTYLRGSKEFNTFNTIAMPLLKPAVATQMIFAFIASWNNFYTPSMILSKQDMYTLPMFIQLLRGERFRTDYGIIYVGLVFTIIPIFVVYFTLSKYIIAGVALGGVKE